MTSWKHLLLTSPFWMTPPPTLGMVPYWRKSAWIHLTEWEERFRQTPICLWSRNFAKPKNGPLHQEWFTDPMAWLQHQFEHWIRMQRGKHTAEPGPEIPKSWSFKTFNFQLRSGWNAFSWTIWVDWCCRRQIPSGHWEDKSDQSRSVFLDVKFPQ